SIARDPRHAANAHLETDRTSGDSNAHVHHGGPEERRGMKPHEGRTNDMSDKPFLTDISIIRKRAREKMNEGAVTASYTADREKVIDILNEVLATELVCTLRYRNHYY